MSLPDDFRSRAKEQRDIANKLLEESDVLTNPVKLVSAIVGQVNATTLESLADTMNYLHLTTSSDGMMERRKAVLLRNDEIRKAAARGDWAAFDKLTGIVKEPTNGSGG